VTTIQKFSANGVGLFDPCLSDSADPGQTDVDIISPASGDSSYFRSVSDDLVERLAYLEDRQRKSDQHDGLNEQRNRGDD
jgi:hypothetical protein